MSLYIDLTEFLLNPITSGIQRITGELCRHFPEDAAAPVRFGPDGYIRLPPALISAIGNHFNEPSAERVAEIKRLAALPADRAFSLSTGDLVLIPEIFIDQPRLTYFLDIPDKHFQHFGFFVHDLLPLTHPEYFWDGWRLKFHCYFKVLRRSSNCAFNSEQTKQQFYRRLNRVDAPDGHVLPLGSDALGPRPQNPALHRPLTFSVLGTVEPRKNHKLILEAFEPLLREIQGLTLSFIGNLGWIDNDFAAKVKALDSDPTSRFQLLSALGDSEIHTQIEASRATIYISTAEGYGLPPMESLWAGTPVIASACVPSLQSLGPNGIHIVEPLTVENLRSAIVAFLHDEYAQRKTREAITLDLPTWQSFTQEVLQWCSS